MIIFRSCAERAHRRLCVGLIAALLWTAGCTDVVTYSLHSQRQGIKLFNQTRYADAAGAFRNAVRQNPRDYKSYYFLGRSYEEMGQYQQAIAAYHSSLDVMSFTEEGRHDEQTRLACTSALAGAIAKSDVRDIETNAAVAKARSSQSGDDYLLVAKIYAARGDPDQSIDAYEHAMLLAPESFYIAKDYGLYLEKMGQIRRAEIPLRRAYALDQFDQQVNAALRRINVVPGPSLKYEKDLEKPPFPKGPIPEVNLGSTSHNSTPAPAPTSPTAQAPRD
ncbi:MAG: tetratricopeptide repeat protein [Tepidisphaeraceae bacterium]